MKNLQLLSIVTLFSLLGGICGGYLFTRYSTEVMQRKIPDSLEVRHLMAEAVTIRNVDLFEKDPPGKHGIFLNKQDGTNVLNIGYGAIFFGPYMALTNPKNKSLWISNSQYDGPRIAFMSGAEPLMDRPSIVIGENTIKNTRTGSETKWEASIGIFDKNGKVIAIMPQK